jgi:hypothetical protein
LVLLLERYGATVRFGDEVPAPGSAARVLVADDDLDDAQRAQLDAFVRGGGIAVIADPRSPFQRAADGDPDAPAVDERDLDDLGEIDLTDPARFQSTIDPGSCSIDALAELRGLAVQRGTEFRVPLSATSCFGADGYAIVRATPSGAGTLVTLGDNGLLTNRLLAFGDNAGLATALLAPERGSVVSLVLGNGPRQAPLPEVGGDERLIDLVRPSVWMGLAQLAVAFVVLAIAVGVRPGRVVDEPVPSPLEGSSLVSATGNLMQRARHAERAAELLRYDVHRRLCARFGVSPTAPLTALDLEMSRRGLAAPGEVIAALSGAAPSDAAGLAALTARLAPLSALADDRLGDPTEPMRTSP